MKKLFTFLFLLVMFGTGYSQSTTVVISQVYGGGGGGTAGATYKTDYIELHNVSNTSQSLVGFSLQYGSTTGQFGSVYSFPAGTSIPAGGYLMIQCGSSGAAGADFPITPDLTTSGINMAATGGKILLASQTTAVGCGATATPCTLPGAAIIDLVAYGSANNAEGGAAVPATTIGSGAVRKNNGCTDTDNNAADFDVVTNPVPRNSATAANTCSGAPAASLTATPNITGLNTTLGVASAPQSYNLSGANLTGFPGNITVTPSTNLEVSLSSGSGFSSNPITVSYTTATLTTTPIYVRVAATAPAGAISGSVTNAGGGAASNAVVTVAGNVVTSEPTIQASNIVVSNITNNGFDVNWSNGDGASRIVSVRAATSTFTPPVDGSVYTTTLGGGNQIWYNGTGTGPVTVTGLTPGTAYIVQAYEYNGSTAGNTNYLTSAATNNPVNATTTGFSPLLVQANFTSVATPLYGGSGNTSRLPVMFIATVSNLTPNTTYKYYTQASTSGDIAMATTGAGNPILIDYTASPVTYAYTATASINTAGGYGKFTTNASGSFTGSFGYVNTGNATKFTAGTVIYPAIALAEESATSIQYRFALNQSITILGFAATAGANDGSFIKGSSSAVAGNIVGLWNTVDGSLFGARPLAMTLVEHPAVSGDAWGTAATNFVANYDGAAGAWNTIIPNANAAGVRLIQQFALAGNVLGCNSDADGIWPSTVNTTNPTNGSATALQLTLTDAPINGGSCFPVLPVSFTSFTAQKTNSNVALKWTTAQELNSRSFIIERSADGRTWTAIATIAAAGNSNTARNYSYNDVTPAKGMNYYRIKQVDLDARSTTSIVRNVLFTDKYEIAIGPNPATDFINVYVSKNDLKSTQVIVSDINGRIMSRYNSADQTIRINTTTFAKGVYVIKVIGEEKAITQKVIVQ